MDLLQMYSVLKYGVQWQRSFLLNIWRKKTPRKSRFAWFTNPSFLFSLHANYFLIGNHGWMYVLFCIMSILLHVMLLFVAVTCLSWLTSAALFWLSWYAVIFWLWFFIYTFLYGSNCFLESQQVPSCCISPFINLMVSQIFRHSMWWTQISSGPASFL